MDMMEILQNLTDDQKDRFMKLESTLESDGWSLILEWADNQRKTSLKRATFAQTWEENRIAVGEAQVYNLLANFGEAVINEFQSLAAQNVEDAEAQQVHDEMEYE